MSLIRLDNSITKSNIQNYASWFFVFIQTLFFFRLFINYYIIRTYLLVETVIVINILLYLVYFYRRMGNILKNDIFIFAIISLTIILIAYMNDKTVDKELYRLLTFPLLLLSMSLVQYNFQKIMRYGFYLCIFAVVYNLGESIYLNIYISQNIHEHPFSKMIIEYFHHDIYSDYFSPRKDFGFNYWRPFGITGLPQKTSFIFTIGILLTYLLKKYDVIRSNIKEWVWYGIFLLSSLFSGGKTGLFASILLISLLKIKRSLFLFAFIFIAVIGFLFFHQWQGNVMPIVYDLEKFLHLEKYKIIFGMGFITAQNLHLDYGFYSESFLVRILTQIGILGFVVLGLSFIFVLRRIKDNRVYFSLIGLIFLLTVHYSITSDYFIMFILFNIILNQNPTEYENGNSS